jgi:hypothetical protein
MTFLSGIRMITQESCETIKKTFIGPGKNRAVRVTPKPILLAPELMEKVLRKSFGQKGQR